MIAYFTELFSPTILLYLLRGFAITLRVAAIAIVLLIINLGFRKHDPDDLWVNRVKKSARRVALVYVEGDPAGAKWLKEQSRRLTQEFARLETYALPAGVSAEERDELLTALKEREDLSDVLVYQQKQP